MAPTWRRTLVFDIGSTWSRQATGMYIWANINNNTSSNYNNLLKWRSSGFNYYSLTLQVDSGPSTRSTSTGIGENTAIASNPQQAVAFQNNISQLTTVSGTITDSTRIAKFFDSNGKCSFCIYDGQFDGSVWYARAKATVVLQKTGTAVTAGNKIEDTDFKITGDFGTALAHSTVAEGSPIKYGSGGTVITASYWNSVVINI